MYCADSTTTIIAKCRARQKVTQQWGSERAKAFKMSLNMTVLKPNIPSWAWTVLVLMNPGEVEMFSLAKALPINTGYTDCSLQIKAMQEIPWKPQLQHSFTMGNICQVTQVSTSPVWFHSYFCPRALDSGKQNYSCSAFGSKNFGQLFPSKRKCWHRWQRSQVQSDHIGCVIPRLGLLFHGTAI